MLSPSRWRCVKDGTYPTTTAVTTDSSTSQDVDYKRQLTSVMKLVAALLSGITLHHVGTQWKREIPLPQHQSVSAARSEPVSQFTANALPDEFEASSGGQVSDTAHYLDHDRSYSASRDALVRRQRENSIHASLSRLPTARKGQVPPLWSKLVNEQEKER
ncbi:MAG: hypothetical protein KDA60_00815 [Planctomycetales bacterium]|nr:hypothetical protein [Planctomycetales bacterium]